MLHSPGAGWAGITDRIDQRLIPLLHWRVGIPFYRYCEAPVIASGLRSMCFDKIVLSRSISVYNSFNLTADYASKCISKEDPNNWRWFF